jgi:hypothetical protein
MESLDGGELGLFAREHHVHYELETEARATAGPGGATFDVRLFASHGEDKLEAPGCPRCLELGRELRSFAERALVHGDAVAWTEIIQTPAVLYASTEPRGPDEVSVTVRVLGEAAPHEEGERGAGADPHLREIQERLRAIGVPLH